MQRRKSKLLSKIAWVALLCLVLTGCSSFYDKNAKEGLLDGKTQEEIKALSDQTVPEGMMQVSINSNPVFPKATEPGNLRIENVPGNSYDMRVTISLKDTNQEVYSSGGIKPNHYVDNVPLSESLKAGTYDAVVKFYAVDKKHKDVGLVTREITLNILE